MLPISYIVINDFVVGASYEMDAGDGAHNAARELPSQDCFARAYSFYQYLAPALP